MRDNKQGNNRVQINTINVEKWVEHCQQFWYNENAEEIMIQELDKRGLDDINLAEQKDIGH